MKHQWNKFVLLCIIGSSLASCSKDAESYLQGRVLVSTKAVGVDSRFGTISVSRVYLISGGTAYHLTFTQQTKMVGMEKQTGPYGSAVPTDAGVLRFHSKAVYRAKGKMGEKESDLVLGSGMSYPVVGLLVDYWELTEPGTGESGEGRTF